MGGKPPLYITLKVTVGSIPAKVKGIEMGEKKKVFKGKKPQEKIERYMIKPHYYQFLGVTVTKDTDIDDVTEDGRVHQTIKGTKFITEIKDKKEQDGIKIKEHSKLEIDLKEGMRLIWQDGQGYVLPEFEPKSVEEVKQDLECLKFDKE